MLKQLFIRNFALIEQCELAFEPGLNVLTGETGAGKSILLDALQAVTGGRVQTDVIRRDRPSADIEAIFLLPDKSVTKTRLEQLGLTNEDDPNCLLISRKIQREGRTICRVNGHLATLSLVRQLTAPLIEFTGQNTQLRLFQETTQRQALDRFGGEQLLALRNDLEQKVSELESLEQEMKELEQQRQGRARQIDLLQYQIDEIDRAALTPGEVEEHRQRRQVLLHAHEINQAILEVSTSLLESDGISRPPLDTIAHCATLLNRLAELNPEVSSLADQFNAAHEQLREITRTLPAYQTELDTDGELNRIEDRLAEIQRLYRKYGDDIEAIIDYRNQCAEELEQLSSVDIRQDHLRERIRELMIECQSLADEITTIRERLVGELSELVTAELKELAMPNGRFLVTLHRLPRFEKHGQDGIQFLFSANLGEQPQSLSEVASGGETSRIMLALRSVLAKYDDLGTLVLDEIDAGIGGQTAAAVGKKLKHISLAHQVICISHQALVAGQADSHFKIEKIEKDGITQTSVQKLKERGARIEELARMLGGAVETAKGHAEAILTNSYK